METSIKICDNQSNRYNLCAIPALVGAPPLFMQDLNAVAYPDFSGSPTTMKNLQEIIPVFKILTLDNS